MPIMTIIKLLSQQFLQMKANTEYTIQFKTLWPRYLSETNVSVI